MTLQELYTAAVQDANSGHYAEAIRKFELILTHEIGAGDKANVSALLGSVYLLVGNNERGVRNLEEVLAAAPNNAAVWSNLSEGLRRLGRLNEAVEASRKALSLKPDHAEAHINMGNALQAQGKLDDAIALYRKALTLMPGYAEAYFNMGNALKDQGKPNDAIASYRQALTLKHDYAEAYNNMGLALQEQSKVDDAIASYRQALTLKPDYADGYYNMGNALGDQGKHDDAIVSYKKVLALKPNHVEAHNNMGIALRELIRLDEAEASYRKAIALKPDFAEAHNNLGVTLQDLGKFNEAEASYRQAIALESNYVEAHSNLGGTLKALGRLKEAEASYRQTISLKPNFAEAHNKLGSMLHERGLGKKSLNCYLRAVSLNPDSVSFRWDLAISQLLKVYLTHDDAKNSLHEFEVKLIELHKFITTEKFNKAAEFVGKSHPYYLAYFEIDNKYLLKKYGDICCRVMKYWQEKNLIKPAKLISKNYTQKKIKIGIVSTHIRYHSVWNAFLKGLVKNLNSDKFEVHIFSLSNSIDNETDLAKSIAKFFFAGEGGLIQWANKIRNSEIDIAFYPEIGMDQKTIQLASMRLAPIQVCSWGHPETSGLPTIDYYISSSLLETSNSDKFYTEKLIKLPGLGCYYEPPTLDSSEVDFIHNGVNQNSPKLLCLGAPNKFSPLYDWVFIEIIRRLEDCQLIFMNDAYGASEILKKRLRDRIEDAGIIFDKHVVFVPQQSRQGFSALMKSSDLLLDSIGFSGFNTTMQAIGCGLPVITREGKFMRTRSASAILRALEIEELITKTEKEYIDLIEKIITDRSFFYQIKCRIKDQENVLYRNEDAVRALEEFFENVISDPFKNQVQDLAAE